MFSWKNVLSYGLLIFSTLSYNIKATNTPIECPGKDVNEIRQQAEQFEISFIFYHVSWSNDSRAALMIYEQIIKGHQEQESIYFALIDCYHLACNCSKTHPLALGSGIPNQWPTLVIRYGSPGVVLTYNGDWGASALRRFINALYTPVARLYTRDDLKALSMQRDAIVLGLFDHHMQLEYRRFVSASVKWLGIDPEQAFYFATAIGEAAEEVFYKADADNATNQSHAPQLLLISSRGIEVMRIEWQVNQIVLWLQQEFTRTHNLMYSYNSPKSLLVQIHVSPVMAVIANSYFYDYLYNLTNPEDIYNRDEFSNVAQLIQADEIEYVKHKLKTKQAENPLKCLAQESLTAWNLRHYHALNLFLSQRICDIVLSCANDDIKRIETLQNANIVWSSKSSTTRKITAAKYLRKFVDSDVRKLKAGQNQTLAIVILDDLKHSDFIESLGIPHVERESGKVTLLIADRSKESIYISQDILTIESLQHFIRSYYNNTLLAYKRSSELKISSPAPPASLMWNKLLLQTASSKTFQSKLEKSNLTTIVLLYSPYCAFSALATQALIQLSAMLDDSSGIRIIRLNTVMDELPWEYKMARTPTLLVFPRAREAESRLFPTNFRMDVRNIFSFVLAQMEPLDKLKSLLSCCRRRKIHSDRMFKCLKYIRTLADKYIAYNKKLQEYEDHRVREDKIAELNEIQLELKTIFPFEYM